MTRLHCSTAAVLLVSLCAQPWHRHTAGAEPINVSVQTAPPSARSTAAIAENALPAARVLLLRDGGVLIGQIARVGDRYVVRRAGSELQVPAANVLVMCPRLEDAYEHRRTLITRPTAEAHLALAEWCIRHELLPQAARELVEARGLAPRHPRVELLERRLAAASRPRARAAQEPVVQASHDRPKPPNKHAAIDRESIEELPDGALERFTRKVQPVLVNNCTTSGCHQPGGQQQFQLDRALLHGLANRRSTRRNLAATLALVDRAQPQLSPLLTVPRRKHGGMSSPIFGPRQQAAFSHLVDWVALVTEPTSPEGEPAPVATGVNAAAPLETSGSPTAAVMSTDFDLESGAAQAIYLDESDELAESEFASLNDRRLQYGAQLQPWQPKDEFDPEIFNRWQRARFRRSKNATAGAPIESR